MVKIFDDEGLQASELIGCAQIRINELEPGKVKDVWLKLVKDLDLQRDNKNRGQVKTSFTCLVSPVINAAINENLVSFATCNKST